MRDAAKIVLHALATIAMLPAIVSYLLKRLAIGSDRALEGSTQALAWLPGLVGVYLRRAFLCQVLAGCDRSASIHFGTIFSQQAARIDANVYVGPNCHLGLVHLQRDVLLASGVHVPSGAKTHAIDRADVPIRDQGGARTLVTIGAGTWVASAAVVLADVGSHSVIAAGSVVTKPIPDYVIAAGVPAQVIRSRREATS